MSVNIAVTVARQYGSGGRDIGNRVAELLGVKVYDRELITMAASRSGLPEDSLDRVDEKATNSLLYTLAMGSSVFGNTAAGFNMPVNDKLFIVQSEIIGNIADRESCVIVGRCGDYVLRDHPGTLSVFVYAPTEARIKRIMERHSVGYDEAKDLMNKTDRRRINYYNFYTGRKWGKFDHYDLMINSHLLGIEGSAQLIADMAERFKRIEDQG